MHSEQVQYQGKAGFFKWIFPMLASNIPGNPWINKWKNPHNYVNYFYSNHDTRDICMNL